MKEITGNFVKIKELNTAVLREALKRAGNGTKQSLAISTGLSEGTCRNIIADLLASGEVIELPFAAPNGGRPARNFAYNFNYSMMALIHLGKEADIRKLCCRVGDAVGRIINETEQILPLITVESIADTVASALAKFPAIKVIAISYPGVVNDGVISHWGDLEELFGCELKKSLELRFPVRVIIENDMNFAARGYLAARAGNDSCRNFAYLAFLNEILPGCGIVANGQLLRGANGFAGEVLALPFGLTPEEQLEQLRSPAGRAEKVSKTILALTSIINPEKIVLCGSMFDESLQHAIRETCRKSIAEPFLPELIFTSGLLHDIMSGLAICAADGLRSSIKLVTSAAKPERSDKPDAASVFQRRKEF